MGWILRIRVTVTEEILTATCLQREVQSYKNNQLEDHLIKLTGRVCSSRFKILFHKNEEKDISMTGNRKIIKARIKKSKERRPEALILS